MPSSARSNKTVPTFPALGSQNLSQDDTRMVVQLYHFLSDVYDKLKGMLFSLISISFKVYLSSVSLLKSG